MAAIEALAMAIERHGGPEVLKPLSLQVPDPGPGEARVVLRAIGLNFADVYQRKGAAGPHRTEKFPDILGAQGAGIVESVGPGVSEVAPGDAVAYVHPGAYTTVQLLPAQRLVPLPEGLTLESAAASLLRGMTAEYLLHRLHAIVPGETVLVHAAAGGMGEILCPWARALGVTVIGTVGSAAKREVALANGCDHVIDTATEDFVARVNALTGGAGVAVVYDAVGRAVFLRSLDCLRTRGIAINFGTASGDVEPFALQILHAKSLIVTRPTLRSYIATREELLNSAGVFAAAVRAGTVPARVTRRYPLMQAQQAHADLESRQTTGSAILVP